MGGHIVALAFLVWESVQFLSREGAITEAYRYLRSVDFSEAEITDQLRSISS